MSETNSVDPSPLALFMIAAISLPLAAVMLKFGGAVPDPTLSKVAGIIVGIVAVIAYRRGDSFGFIALMIVAAGIFLSGTGIADWGSIVFGILFAFTGLWAIFIKTPKILVAIIFIATAIFILLGLSSGIIENADFDTIVGVLALINFFLSSYLGFALATEKLPVI